MNLLASAIKSATYGELKDLAESVAASCGDASGDMGGAKEGMPPNETDIIEAIHAWANWTLKKEQS